MVEKLITKEVRMVTRVIYRPFEEDDFEAVASILQQTWHTLTPDSEYNMLEASYDLARAFSNSSFSQVVVINDRPQGIILARADGDELPYRNMWDSHCPAMLEELHRRNERAARVFASWMENEERVNAQLYKESGLSCKNQITLLAVADSARGMGVGSILLDAAASYLSSRGASDLILYTDTDCTWKFYEKRGLTRAASYRSSREERRYLPKEMYLYGLDLSA